MLRLAVPCLCRAAIADSLKSVTQQLHEAEARSQHLLDLEADLDSREELFNHKVLMCAVLCTCLWRPSGPAADANAARMIRLWQAHCRQTCFHKEKTNHATAHHKLGRIACLRTLQWGPSTVCTVDASQSQLVLLRSHMHWQEASKA